MSAPDKRNGSHAEPESNGQQEVESRLQEVCDRITRTSYDDLTPLGMYSIHDGSTRMITLPSDADGFDDATAVKQYCYENGGQKFLIVAPVDI